MNTFAKIKFVTIKDSDIEECCVEAWAWDEPNSVAADQGRACGGAEVSANAVCAGQPGRRGGAQGTAGVGKGAV